MSSEYESSSSTPEKLALLVFITAIIIGNICVCVTYLIRAEKKHWSNVFILGMTFLDLFIGSFVLPMRFVSVYGSPFTANLCAALSIGEACAFASIIYSILFMIYTRLYDIKQAINPIHRRYPLILLFISWVIFFLFYGIPFMVNHPNYLLPITISNVTSYCTTYTISIYRPLWMSYTEIGLIYSVPILSIVVGLYFLIHHLCQPRPRGLDLIQRRNYMDQKQMTWHVVVLSLTFLFLWLPWIIIRILFIFQTTEQIQQALQITYYILILKSVIFPILYASTNSSFRGSFAIYKHKRINMNRVWTVNG